MMRATSRRISNESSLFLVWTSGRCRKSPAYTAYRIPDRSKSSLCIRGVLLAGGACSRQQRHWLGVLHTKFVVCFCYPTPMDPKHPTKTTATEQARAKFIRMDAWFTKSGVCLCCLKYVANRPPFCWWSYRLARTEGKLCAKLLHSVLFIRLGAENTTCRLLPFVE